MSPAVCGIIAEYNPFHSGHLYHLEQTRARLGPDTRFIVVLSGHGVQRGEFPLLTKAARTEMALRAGIDLVLELPIHGAVAGAERFARAGVSILRRAGVTHLSFGSESGELAPLQQAAEQMVAVFPKDASLARSYPQLFPKLENVFTPNNILGLEYLRALQGTEITAVTVKRQGSGHDDGGLSASGLRALLRAGALLPAGALPAFSGEILSRELAAGCGPIPPWGEERAFLSYLRRLSPADFAALPEVTGGLESRLYRAAQQAGSAEALMALAKTKRFTAARLRRAFFGAFLGLTEAQALCEPPLRLLGIGQHGAELLGAIAEPVLSKAANHRDALALEARVTDQLALAMPVAQAAGGEWRERVVLL